MSFVLVVDDFGIKYSSPKDLNHFLNALHDIYSISVDMSGLHYVGLDINWNYKYKYVDISMPHYIPDLLQQLVYTPSISEYAPNANIWSQNTICSKR